MIAFGLPREHLRDRHRVRHDLGVDPGLAHPAGDQLGVLRAEVDDEDQVVFGGHAVTRPRRTGAYRPVARRGPQRRRTPNQGPTGEGGWPSPDRSRADRAWVSGPGRRGSLTVPALPPLQRRPGPGRVPTPSSAELSRRRRWAAAGPPARASGTAGAAGATGSIRRTPPRAAGRGSGSPLLGQNAIARSAWAVIVSDGFTPRLAEIAEPSATCRPG